MSRDTIYNTPQPQVPPFEFNARVAAVFDDMIHRSIPGYEEIITRQAQMIQRFYQPRTRIFDLGCSNGNLGMALCGLLPPMEFSMVAADSSSAMLDVYAARLAAQRNKGARIDLICSDITDLRLADAGVVVINFTLQFLPLFQRDRLIRDIHRALAPGGILLLSEKIVHAEAALDDLQKEFYHGFKRENGYSELEISQKREALEDVLIPETIASHSKRLTGAGFAQQDIWCKWFNFCSWICIK